MTKRIKIIKVGTTEKPANEADIENLLENLSKVSDGGIIVTHHAIEIVELEYEGS
jgi:hypothetical protein